MKVIGIATKQSNGSLQATTESRLAAKTLQQYQPTKVSEVPETPDAVFAGLRQPHSRSALGYFLARASGR